MEVIRNEELHQMINMIQKKPYGKFLISGDAGSGKTFLLNTLGKLLQESMNYTVQRIVMLFLIVRHIRIWRRRILVEMLQERI